MRRFAGIRETSNTSSETIRSLGKSSKNHLKCSGTKRKHAESRVTIDAYG
jgi:hypothetical protein